MSQSNALTSPATTVIIGVDTHKEVHVAVALDGLGARVGSCSATADRAGYAELVAWARTFGPIGAFGIEGTGSYGVGLASFVRRQAIRVIEVSHCDRRTRRNNGKSDTLDAETAARSVLAGIATAVPKTADGAAEMVRQIKVARDTAVKAKTAAIITLKALIVNAPGELREAREPLTDRKLIDRCARLLPGGTIADTTASTKHALRALATRWLALSTEIEAHDGVLDTVTRGAAPTLREAFGIGPDSAAEMMIVLGDNPTRIRVRGGVCQALWGVSHSRIERTDQSTPALSGRPSPGQRRALSHRHCPHALASTDDGLRRSTDGRGFEQEGHHPLPETLRGTRDLSCPHRRSSFAHRRRAGRLTNVVTHS